MAYEVSFTPRAERDLALLFESIDASRPGAVQDWYAGLKAAILTLCRQPQRCPKTPESAALRHLLYGRIPHIYRAIFRVRAKAGQVEILHIRHGARQRLKPSGLS